MNLRAQQPDQLRCFGSMNHSNIVVSYSSTSWLQQNFSIGLHLWLQQKGCGQESSFITKFPQQPRSPLALWTFQKALTARDQLRTVVTLRADIPRYLPLVSENMSYSPHIDWKMQINVHWKTADTYHRHALDFVRSFPEDSISWTLPTHQTTVWLCLCCPDSRKPPKVFFTGSLKYFTDPMPACTRFFLYLILRFSFNDSVQRQRSKQACNTFKLQPTEYNDTINFNCRRLYFFKKLRIHDYITPVNQNYCTLFRFKCCSLN